MLATFSLACCRNIGQQYFVFVSFACWTNYKIDINSNVSHLQCIILVYESGCQLAIWKKMRRESKQNYCIIRIMYCILYLIVNRTLYVFGRIRPNVWLLFLSFSTASDKLPSGNRGKNVLSVLTCWQCSAVTYCNNMRKQFTQTRKIEKKKKTNAKMYNSFIFIMFKSGSKHHHSCNVNIHMHILMCFIWFYLVYYFQMACTVICYYFVIFT